MARFDRYLLSQLLTLFGFFALVLVSIYWINQAVRLFDRLIADGQTAWVFLEFTALTLPNMIRIVMPMAAFAAAAYVTNRLSSESELVVMQATGFSPWRLARPVLQYGVVLMALMLLLTHVLVPLSKRQMEVRNGEVAQNLTARLLTEGTFLHPIDGVTFYIRDISPEGELRDVFLSDRRDPAEAQSFTSSRAYIVNAAEDGGAPRPKLVMIDGLSQTLDLQTDRLFTTHFQSFSYDIGSLIRTGGPTRESPQTMSTLALMNVDAAVEATGRDAGRIVYEFHNRFQQAMMCVVTALIGFAALMVGGFSRFGVWKQIVFAVVLLILIKFLEGVVGEPVEQDPALWPLVYLPPLVGMLIGGLLLWWAARPRRRRRRREVAA